MNLRLIDDKELSPALRRPRLGTYLRFVTDSGGRLRDCARLDPDDFLKAVQGLAGVAAALPVGALSQEQRAPLRRYDVDALPGLLNDLAEAQERARAAGVGVVFGPSPAELRGLAAKLSRYRSIRAKVSVALHGALDMRQVFSGLIFALLSTVSEGVQGWLADDSKKADRTKVQIGFAALLLNRERVQQAMNLHREANAAQKADLEQRISEAAADQELEDVESALAMNLPVSRDALERAALRYAQKHPPAPAPAPPTPAPTRKAKR